MYLSNGFPEYSPQGTESDFWQGHFRQMKGPPFKGGLGKVQELKMIISLNLSDVDAVWTWRDKRPPSPPENKYSSEIFSPSYLKLIEK